MPRRGLHSRTRLFQRLPVLWLIWPVHHKPTTLANPMSYYILFICYTLNIMVHTESIALLAKAATGGKCLHSEFYIFEI